MRSLKKNRLLLFPLLFGFMLLVYSWGLSYPLSTGSVDDVIFNHVPIFYWIGLSLMLPSMCLLAVSSKSTYLKWIMTVGIIAAMYSLSYFYYLLPGSDSHYIRGMTEYTIATQNLDPLQPGKFYFQWPLFFVLGDITTSMSGLALAHLEFFFYALIGGLLATALFIYASKPYKNGGFLAVIAFFIALSYYLNYQFVPFSLAFGLLVLLFVLESREKSSSQMAAILILYTGIVVAHAFVPLFFIIYVLMRYALDRSNKRYGEFFLLALVIWLTVQITIASSGFARNIWTTMTLPSEYSGLVKTTALPALGVIDATAQKASLAVTMATGLICVVGFIFVLIRKKMREVDRGILFTGLLYSALGIVLYTLGSRAWPLAFIPVSLGLSYMFESRLRPYLKPLLVILLILFTLVPLHTSFYRDDVMFQTEEAYKAANFFIDRYNWTNHSFVLANFRVTTYLDARLTGNAYASPDPRDVKDVDAIFYTIGLGKHLSLYNYTLEGVFHEEILNVIYSNGFSLTATRVWNFSWAPKA